MTGVSVHFLRRIERERGGSARRQASGRRSGQEGVALLLALMLLVVLSLLAFALVTRGLVASRIAGLERFATMTFYAADAGVAGAKARLRLGRIEAFDFGVREGRGVGAVETGRPIAVEVSPLVPAGPPRLVVGSQIGGGQGDGGESLCELVYRGGSRAVHGLTGSRREISMTLIIGPVPLERVMPRDGVPEGGGE